MLKRVLELLKKEDDYAMSEYIASELNIEIVEVWESILNLKNMGYNIQSIKNKGYLLIREPFIFNKLEIEEAILTDKIGKECYFFDEINSTNDYAKTLAEGNSPEGVLVVADYQKSGKGRLGRNWVSEKGEGIYMSMILKPDIQFLDLPKITMIASISVCEAFAKIGIEAFIKWPNDIVINGRKVCGILCEVNSEIDKLKYIVMGIGINANNMFFEDDIKQKATSIFLETNQKFERKHIIGDILEKFEAYYYEYIQSGKFEKILYDYKQKCININKKVKTVYKNKNIEGLVLDVLESGEIEIDCGDEIIKMLAGEVSIRNIDGRYT